MASSPEPHVVIGRHPDHGIVATNPTQHHVVDWYFARCNFSRVPGHPFLYAFDGPPGTETTRTQAMVGLMRRAGFTVETDLTMPPSEPAQGAGITPDVAFAEHPQLGLVAATASTHEEPDRGDGILRAHGWLHQTALDIYTLPAQLDSPTTLATLANTVQALHSEGRVVAVQPELVTAARGTIANKPPSAHEVTASTSKEASLPSSHALPNAAEPTSTRVVHPEAVTDRRPPRGR
ncbi:hypothetical protein ACNFRX_00425 [Streptomyces griseoaurantiacus]|uniref:hypothetical protein n=1 Tax=Streptomyces griseoaurantiacus TaxID=68213 RepID=UPI003F1A3496